MTVWGREHAPNASVRCLRASRETNMTNLIALLPPMASSGGRLQIFIGSSQRNELCQVNFVGWALSTPLAKTGLDLEISSSAAARCLRSNAQMGAGATQSICPSLTASDVTLA